LIQEIDHHRARVVVSRIYEAFKIGEGLLSEQEDLVENQIPRDVRPLSRDHSLFLFYVVVNDHGIKSSRLYEKAKSLFLTSRFLFEPSEVLSQFTGPDDIQLIEYTGARLGTRYPRETAKTWYLNSIKLLEKHDGDPRRLFRCTTDAPLLLKEILSFRGYGPKIGGMLVRAIAGLGFSNLDNLDKVLVPVDIHDSRISFFTGIIKNREWLNDSAFDYYSHVRVVQKMLLDTCNSLGIKWLDVDRALWLIGSRGCVPRRCHECPLQNVCYVGRPQNLQLNYIRRAESIGEEEVIPV
jgi:endonuclease III